METSLVKRKRNLVQNNLLMPGDNAEVVVGLSASAKKVHRPDSPQVHCSQSCISGYRMVSSEVLANAFQQVVCSSCASNYFILLRTFLKEKVALLY